MSKEEIDRILHSAVDDGIVPGVAAMVAGPSDVHYCGTFGKANVSIEAPVTRDTIYKVSSWTKAITTTALMQLVERGLIKIDQPVASIIPTFKDIQILEGFDGETPKLRPPRNEVTIGHLATHTSGLAYDIWSDKLLKYKSLTGAPSGLVGGKASLLSPLMFEPGTEWAYGTGIDWLGEVIEIVSGQRVDRYLEEMIFTPLAMKDTSFSVSDAKRARIATVHTRKDENSFTPIEFEWAPTLSADRVLSGHGLYSTLDDYTSFLQMFLNEGTGMGRQILRPETVRSMTENRIGDVNVGVMKSTVPHLSCDAEFFPGMPKRHSLGFQITTEQWAGMRSAGSLSWAGLLNLFYWWDPTRKLAVTFATQLLPFQDKRVMELFVNFEKAVYKAPWAK